MRSRAAAVAITFLAAVAVLAGGAGAARADAPACAQTASGAQPASPTPGNPCWSDVNPYPFGYDGNPVDPNSPYCANPANTESCYLQVTSLAFRSWNRGLAATSPTSVGSTTAFGVWLYNGTRWFADPTFPGQSVCPGTRVLWAGKLDYWLVGVPNGSVPSQSNWPRLCRFDGINDGWEPLAVPAATIAKVGPTGGITSGACFAWNNCWFFGTGGAVLHWDGSALSNESVGLGASPWLSGTYLGATASADAHGNPFAVAVGAANPNARQPDGSPAPQLFTSSGGPFSPASFSPDPGGSYQTDLVAAAFDGTGDGWTAGDPAGESGLASSSFSMFPNDGRVQPAPLLPVSSQGGAQSCPATPPGTFTWYSDGRSRSYLWSSIGVMPGGEAIAGGKVGQISSGNPQEEPVLSLVSCSQAPQVTSFRVPNPAGGGNVPADDGGFITSVAASAVNDAWAASSAGGVSGASGVVPQPPHIYQFTDGQTPDASPGDDVESRPLVVSTEPTIFQFAPPVVIPPPPPPSTVTQLVQAPKKRVRLRSPIYDVQKPKLAKRGRGVYTLSISFKVRRKVTIGLEALRHGKVVSSSGLKTFTGKKGTLVVVLSPRAWPTGLKFIQPHQAHK